MWEFSLSISSERRDIANKIYACFSEQALTYENIVTSYENSGKITIITSCNDFDKHRFKLLIEEIVCDSICNGYKSEFLFNNLEIMVSDEVAKEAFLEALILFDRETDAYLVSKYLIVDNKLDLDGFYNFRLKPLKDKWMELVNIANENQIYLYSNETFIELIKFLVDNIEVRSDIVNVVHQNDNYVLLDAQYNEINIDKDILNKDSKLLSCLISLCPKVINIYCSEHIPGAVTKLICQLFEKRVKFLTKTQS